VSTETQAWSELDGTPSPTTAADFYEGRGVGARYLGTMLAMGDPSNIGVLSGLGGPWGLFQSTGPEYTRGDYVSTVRDLVDTSRWPHNHTDSTGTAWAYAYDTGTVYVYHRGVEMALIRCNLNRWVPEDRARIGGDPDYEERVPRRASNFPTFPARSDEG
jgi:hypothetical protein